MVAVPRRMRRIVTSAADVAGIAIAVSTATTSVLILDRALGGYRRNSPVFFYVMPILMASCAVAAVADYIIGIYGLGAIWSLYAALCAWMWWTDDDTRKRRRRLKRAARRVITTATGRIRVAST